MQLKRPLVPPHIPPPTHLHIFLRHVSLPTHTPAQYSDNIKN